jgi:hypothetical protein
MISYWKTQWFNIWCGFINLGFAIYNLTQGDRLMCLCWVVSALLWFTTARINYNDDRIKALEERVKELEDHKEKEKENVTENNR